ncbi:MAG TPA: collagen-like protein [Solirubrobacteraceae bacterium]|nr:collagen-like protein [Solirubrobacteraceae bacterium]
MRRIRIHTPSPAMVVALVALFVALGSGAYAAITLPANSVGTKQLKNRAVTAQKVKTHSLLSSNFKPGQLPQGPKGDPGPKGDKGDKGVTGASGPSGPGATFKGAWKTTNQTIGSGCTTYLNVSIYASTPGTVMVTGQISINLDHTQGTVDLMVADLGTWIVDCGNASTQYERLINPSLPTDPAYEETATMAHYYTIKKAGLYTYYMNAAVTDGQDPGDQFKWGTMTAVFFPNP